MFCRIRAKTRESSRNRSVEAAIFVEISGILEIGIDKFEFDEVILLEKIIEYIKQKYNPLSIILYGSYANGTNNLNSDFDALVISYDHEQFHDTSFVNDIQLDVFVYPASYFDGEFDCNNFIQILYPIFDYPHEHYTFKHFEV